MIRMASRRTEGCGWRVLDLGAGPVGASWPLFVALRYVHLETFGLHPHGQAIARFAEAAMASFRAAGGTRT